MKSVLSLCILFGLLLSACQSSSDKKTITVAATSVPHAEILEQVTSKLKDKGITLKIIVVEDYNTPNRALADQEIDANYFQHVPFMEFQKQEFGYPISKLVAVHIEPMGLYSKKHKSLNEIKEGSIVAIPSDPTNEARALELMESAGLIKLNDHGINTSIFNVSENPLKLKFHEIDSPLLTRSLDDVDYAAITTNFALQAGFSPIKDALAIEKHDSPYVNVIVVRNGDEGREELVELKHAITEDRIRDYINNKFKGSVIPVFVEPE